MSKIDVEITSPRIAVEIEGGTPGLSAYEIWLKAGNEGSVEDFLNSLRGSGAETFIYEQIEAKTQWNIVHYLNKFPSVTIIDTGGNIVVGEVRYIDRDKVTLKFNFEFSGSAYLN